MIGLLCHSLLNGLEIRLSTMKIVRDTLDDIQLLVSLHKLLTEADIVVCHNVKFDIPKIKARMVLNNILPPKPFKTYCTLKLLRKTLDSLLINSHI